MTSLFSQSYVDDMTDSINNQKSPEAKALEDHRAHSSVLSQEQVDSLQRNNEYHYTIRIAEYEEPLASLKGIRTMYVSISAILYASLNVVVLPIYAISSRM